MNTEVAGAETSPCCEVCHLTESLKTCSRCHGAFYCGRVHQVLHWSTHKAMCKDFRSDQEPAMVSSPSAPMVPCRVQSESPSDTNNSVSAQRYGAWNSSDSYLEDTVDTPGEVLSPESSYSEWDVNDLITQDPSVSSQVIDQPSTSASETSESSNLQIDNDLLDFTTKYLLSGNYADSNPVESVSMDYDLTSVTEQIFDDNSFSLELPVHVQMQQSKLASSMPSEDVCKSIVHDLNVHGICVMDKFLGFQVGELILGEVRALFQRGLFQKGQLVNSSTWKSTEDIRGDIISWVSGNEAGCEYTGSLIRRLDDVMNRCSRMEDNGILSRYKLSKRTKAMVACYPGNGTHYKKHIDNPDGDGRCITCIYYLNKGWDVEKQGGLLRMFPTSHEDEIANIEPVFDRMLFFWSDRRNPHEVLPSYDVRYAITVWYFDSDERERALIGSGLQQKQQ